MLHLLLPFLSASQPRRLLQVAVCLSAATMGGLWPLEVSAEPMLVVARGVGAGSEKAAGYVNHYLVEMLGADSRYEVVDLVQALSASEASRAQRAFKVADEMFQKGRDAYEALNLDVAVDYLNTAIGKYERHGAYVTAFDKVASTLMLLGATHILRGEDRAGTRRLSQAVTVYPQVEPDPRVFNPGMRKIFQDVARRMQARPSGGLSVSSNPSYAEVYVDGVFRGVSPVALQEITEGGHYVRLTKPGYRPWGRLVDVVGKDEVARNASMKAEQKFQQFDGLVDAAIKHLNDEVEPIDASIGQLGALVNADQVFLTEVRLDGEQVEVMAHQFNLKRQSRTKSARQVFSYSNDLDTYRREVSALLEAHFDMSPAPSVVAAGGGTMGSAGASSAAGLGVGGSYSDGDACSGGSCGNAPTWVLVSGLTAGGLLMAGGGGLWALAKQDNDSYRQSAQISQIAADLRDSGERKAVIGDVLFGLGALCTVGSVLLYTFWEPEPGVDDMAQNPQLTQSQTRIAVLPMQGGMAASASFTF